MPHRPGRANAPCPRSKILPGNLARERMGERQGVAGQPPGLAERTGVVTSLLEMALGAAGPGAAKH